MKPPNNSAIHEARLYDVRTVLDSLGDTLASPLGLVSVAELTCLLFLHQYCAPSKGVVEREVAIGANVREILRNILANHFNGEMSHCNLPVEAPEGTMAPVEYVSEGFQWILYFGEADCVHCISATRAIARSYCAAQPRFGSNGVAYGEGQSR